MSLHKLVMSSLNAFVRCLYQIPMQQHLLKSLWTLNSNREPRPEYPRIRRVLVEAVISIVRLCPDPYRSIFREKKAKDALDMVKGTPSRLERYRVFINGEGVLPESLPMRGLVDKAKKLIYRPTPTTSAEQAGEHA